MLNRNILTFLDYDFSVSHVIIFKASTFVPQFVSLSSNRAVTNKYDVYVYACRGKIACTYVYACVCVHAYVYFYVIVRFFADFALII